MEGIEGALEIVRAWGVLVVAPLGEGVEPSNSPVPVGELEGGRVVEKEG